MLQQNHSTLTHINNDINKELWAYVPSLIAHVFHKDFIAMILQGQKGHQGIFLPFRS